MDEARETYIEYLHIYLHTIRGKSSFASMTEGKPLGLSLQGRSSSPYDLDRFYPGLYYIQTPILISYLDDRDPPFQTCSPIGSFVVSVHEYDLLSMLQSSCQ